MRRPKLFAVMVVVLACLATLAAQQFPPSGAIIYHPDTGKPAVLLESIVEAATIAATGSKQAILAIGYGFDGTADRRLFAKPCDTEEQITTPISITTDTVIIPATTGKKNYICDFVAVAGAAEIVSITEGTGTLCGTSEAALMGSTTDANGVSLAASGGFPGGFTVNGKTANVDTCLNVSGTNRVSGLVNWVQR
jgi:hypothetical protein